ncbi:hypothetical protein ES703_26740 [subsurface metagenome]
MYQNIISQKGGLLKKVFVGLVLVIALPLSIHSQTYWNLEPVWVKAEPESSQAWGMHLSAGDVNSDGFNDLGIYFGYWLPNPYWHKVAIFLGAMQIDTVPYIILSAEKRDDNFGFSFDFTDFNGDGYDDVVVGAGNYTIGGHCWGRAYVYFGGENMDSIPDWKKTGSYDSDFGRRVTVGNFNNDGCSDIAVSNPTENDDGMAYIFYGSPNPDTIPDVTLVGVGGGPTNALFGCEISGGYDINGDEYDDLIVGSEGYNGLNGRVYIFFGGNPMDSIPDLKFGGPGGFFGDNLGMLGDIDGDGYGDFGVGKWPDTLLIYKGGETLDSIYDYIYADEDTAQNSFANSFDGVGPLFPGDVNRQVIIGAWCYGDSAVGKTYLFQGGLSLDTICDAFAEGYVGMGLGYKVADAGDVNGDGANEIIFSNLPDTMTERVWICKYVGPGIKEEETDRRHKTQDIRLLPPYPNPFTTATTITLQSSESRVPSSELKIYDVSGRMVRCLKKIPNSQLPILNYVWDGKDTEGNEVRSGIYFVKLKGDMVEKLVKLNPKR